MPPSSEPGPRSSAETGSRLAEAIDAWLPTKDPGLRAQINELMQRASTTGVDPIAAMQAGLTTWFGGPALAVLLRAEAVTPIGGFGQVALEPSRPVRQPTLWPQRPKRLTDELFSSWLCRSAVAAGISPLRFARDVGCLELLADVDQDVSPATLERLALLSGQTPEHLARGTLPDHPTAPPETTTAAAEDLLLRDGRFLLGRRGLDGRGRAKPTLQYCPSCFQQDDRPYFRRSWRFAHQAVCGIHGCRLHDRCWRCGTSVSPLAQRHAEPQLRCQACEAPLLAAPIHFSPKIVLRQRSLGAMLFYLATQVAEAERHPHLDALAKALRSTKREPVAIRARRVAELRPSQVDAWFGPAASPSRASVFKRLATNGATDRLLTKRDPEDWRKRLRAARSTDPPRWLTDPVDFMSSRDAG